MSIRPVDMQVAIQRSDQYSKEFNKNIEVGNYQHETAIETQKQVFQSQREVNPSEGLKHNAITRDDDSKTNTGKKRYKNDTESRSHNKKEDAMSTDDDKGVFIDIII